MNFERIYLGLKRRVTDIPHRMAWHRETPLTLQNREQLRSLKDRHKGERCVIIGNGPSLNRMDLSLLKHEITFGLNRIYLLFPKIDFTPTYYASVNEYVLKQFHHEIRPLAMPKFINWTFRKYFLPGDDSIFIRMLYDPHFSQDITDGFWAGGTVTYVCMQIAYYMGFKEVILIGVDHSFKEQGVSNQPIASQQDDINHFHPDYFGKGTVWQLPDYQQTEWAYSMAKEVFEHDGRQIVDATVDGKLQVFPKVDLSTLLQ
ncbi:6-hydroxymethylpterin diphosphokinase MptE-like protein [Candidatus Neomarinimicrobiota bacterium]